MWFTIKQFASIFSELVINHFLVLWTTVPIALCIWGMASLRRSHSTRASLPVQRKAWNRSRAFHGLRTLDWVVAVTFLVFLGLFVYSTMHGENFANYDESQLTNYSIQGKTFRPPIWPDNGRFFPLANQEFNLLKYVTQSPEGYHAFALLQLGLMFVPLLILLQEWQLWGRLLILMSLMVTPSIMISFSGLIYPERNVLFCLAILLAGIQGLNGSHRRICLGIGFLAAHFALYYKEPVFLFLSAFAGTQLLSSWFVERETQERSIASFLRKHVMEMGLIALACLFLIFYAGTMLPHPSFSYASHFPLDRLTVLALYLKVDALLVLFLSAAVLRFVYLLWTRTAPDRFWDSLCVGGVAYFLGFIALGIFSGYYMAPVDLVATLYLSHLVRPCFCRQKQVWAAVTTLVVALAVLQNVAYSSFRMIERKNVISGKGQLADFLIDYARSARERPIDLFFPFAEGFVLGELSSFFEYKGAQVVRQNAGGPTRSTFLLETPRELPDARCVPYRPYTCAHADSPDPGCLLVILPDDKSSGNELTVLTHEGKLLFHYQPVVPIPKWFVPLFLKFHVISPMFVETAPPSNWLQLYVYGMS